MGFYERLPFTNKHGLNEDWLIMTVKDCEAKVTEYTEIVNGLKAIVDEMDPRITALEENLASVAGDLHDVQVTLAEHGRIITSFQETLTSIENRLTIIVNDITTLYANVSRVENESKGRDNSLDARIRLLEAATIEPITVYNATDNKVAFGNDLRFANTDPDTGLPYGMTNTSGAFSFVENEGFLIGENYDNSGYIEIATDAYQLQRNANYSITIGIFNDQSYRDPVKVVTWDSIPQEYGQSWTYSSDLTDLGVIITPGGAVQIAWRNNAPDTYEGKYIRYISVIEASTAVPVVQLNRSEGMVVKAAQGALDAAFGSEEFTSDWFPAWSGTGTEEAIDVLFNYATVGKLFFGQIALKSPYDDDPIGNGTGQTTEIDISSLDLPAVALEGLVGNYADTYTGQSFDVLFANDNDILDKIVIRHYWPGNIIPQSNGHFATINFLTVLS